MKLCEKIAYYRKKAGMSQIDLADAMEVSRQSVSKWETGEANPDITKLKSLAKVLDVSVDELLSDEEPADSQEETVTKSHNTAYPDWLDSLPSFFRNAAIRSGWLLGAYIAVSGAVFTVLAFYARKQVFNNTFDSLIRPGDTIDGITIDYVMEEASSFNAASGLLTIMIILGVAYTIFGLVLAARLHKWKNETE